MSRYEKGKLNQTAALRPLDVQYNRTFKPKIWNGTPDYFDPTHVWSKDGTIYYSYYDWYDNENFQYRLDGNTWVQHSWEGDNRIPGYDVWTSNGNYYCSHYDNGIYRHLKLNGNRWEVIDLGLDFEGHYICDINGSTIVTKSNITYKFTSRENFIQSVLYNEMGNSSMLWSDGKNLYVGTSKIYSKEENKFIPYNEWNIEYSTYLTSYGGAVYSFPNLRLVGKVFMDDPIEVPADMSETPFYNSFVWSDGTNVYFTFRGNSAGINHDYSYMWEPASVPNFEHELPSTANTVTINLYMNNSEKNVIGKSLTSVRNLNGTFKQEADITNLSIQVDLSSVPNFNYIRVPLFNRYYFVDNIVNIRDDLWEISCHVDVLESFKDTIMSTYGLIERNEFEFNPKIIDHLRVIEQGVTTEVLTDGMTLETVLTAGVPQTMTETSPRFMLVGTFMNLEGEIL